MLKILDQTGDLNGQQTHRLFSLYPVPDFVKEASSAALYGDDGLASGLYADPVARQFPCHCKEATLVSAMFLWDNLSKLTNKEAATIEHRIINRAKFYGIEPEFTKLKKAFEKRASRDPYKDLHDSEFALIFDLPDGTVERHYPLRNPDEIKAAAHYMQKYQNAIPLIERQKMAQRILDKSVEKNAPLGNLEEFVDKQAGYGVCAASDAAQMLRTRAVMLKRAGRAPEIRNQLEHMANTCEEFPEQVRNRESLVKLAGIVDELDRACGLASEYADGLNRPEDVLFGVTIKMAQEFVNEHCSSITGNMYKIADLRKIELDSLRDVFGDEFADSVSAGGLLVSPEKLAEQLSALPRPDAEMLDRLLEQAGIQPMAKEAADKSQWQDREFLSELASHRGGVSGRR